MARFIWRYPKKYFRLHQRRTYTMLGLTLLSLSIFGNFAIRPALVTVIELNKKLKEQKESVEGMDEKIRNLSLAQVEIKKISSDLPKIEEALPGEEDFSTLIEDIHALSKKNNLRLEGMYFERQRDVSQHLPTQSLAVKTLPFLLQTEGNFFDFLSFLQGSQNLLRQNNMKRVRVTSYRRGGAQNLGLAGEFYFYSNE